MMTGIQDHPYREVTETQEQQVGGPISMSITVIFRDARQFHETAGNKTRLMQIQGSRSGRME